MYIVTISQIQNIKYGVFVTIMLFFNGLSTYICPFTFRQEYLETWQIYMTLWRKRRWLSKLRQFEYKKSLLRMLQIIFFLIFFFGYPLIFEFYHFLSYLQSRVWWLLWRWANKGIFLSLSLSLDIYLYPILCNMAFFLCKYEIICHVLFLNLCIA